MSRFAALQASKKKRFLLVKTDQLEFVDESDLSVHTIKYETIAQVVPSPNDPKSFIVHINGQKKPEQHAVMDPRDRPFFLNDFFLAYSKVKPFPSTRLPATLSDTPIEIELTAAWMKVHNGDAFEMFLLQFLSSIETHGSHALLRFVCGKSLLISSEGITDLINQIVSNCQSFTGVVIAPISRDSPLVSSVLYPSFSADKTVYATFGYKSVMAHAWTTIEPSFDYSVENHVLIGVTDTHLIEFSTKVKPSQGIVSQSLFSTINDHVTSVKNVYSLGSIVAVVEKEITVDIDDNQRQMILISFQRSCGSPLSLLLSPSSASGLSSAITVFHSLGKSLLRPLPWTKTFRSSALPQPTNESYTMLLPADLEIFKTFEEPIFKSFFNYISALPVLDSAFVNKDDVISELETLLTRVENSLLKVDSFVFGGVKQKSHKNYLPKIFNLLEWLVNAGTLVESKNIAEKSASLLISALSVASFLFSEESFVKEIEAAHVSVLLRLLISENYLVRIHTVDLILSRLFLYTGVNVLSYSIDKKKEQHVKKIVGLLLSQDLLEIFYDVVTAHTSYPPLFVSSICDLIFIIKKLFVPLKKDTRSISMINSIINQCIPFFFDLISTNYLVLIVSASNWLALLAQDVNILKELQTSTVESTNYLSILMGFIRFSSIYSISFALKQLLSLITINNSVAFNILKRCLPEGLIATLIHNKQVPTPKEISELSFVKNCNNLAFPALEAALGNSYEGPTLIVNHQMKSEMIDCLINEILAFKNAQSKLGSEVKILWNSNDFLIDLPSLAASVPVSGFYLSPLVKNNSQGLDLPPEIVQKLLVEAFHLLCLVDNNNESLLLILSSMIVLMEISAKISETPGNTFIPTLPECKYLVKILEKSSGDYQKLLVKFFKVAVLISQNIAPIVSSNGISIFLNILYSNLLETSEQNTEEINENGVELAEICPEILDILVHLSKVSSATATIIFPPSPSFRALLEKQNLRRIVALLSHSDSKVVLSGYEIISNIISASLSSGEALLNCAILELILFHLLTSEDFRSQSISLLAKLHRPLFDHFVKFLPKNLVSKLAKIDSESDSINDFYNIFTEDTDTAVLVWNETTRQHLTEYLSEKIAKYSYKNFESQYSLPLDFYYPTFKREVIANGIFLRNLTNYSSLSDAGVEDPMSLYTEILSLINQKIEFNPNQIVWILLSIKMIVAEYGRVDKNELFSKIPQSLFKFCLENLTVSRDGLTKSIPHPELVSPSLDTLKSLICIDFVDSSTSTLCNVKSLVDSNGITVLCSLLSYYGDHLDSDKDASEIVRSIASVITETIVQGSFNAEVFNEDALKPLISSIGTIFAEVVDNDLLFKDVAKLVKKLCVYPELAQCLLDSGLPLRMLLYVLSNYSKENIGTNISVVSEGLLEFAKNPVGSELFESIFSSYFAKMLVKCQVADFITKLTTKTETPLIVWTEATRNELIEYLNSYLKELNPGTKIDIKIEYKSLKDEVKIDQIYLRLFQLDPAFHVPNSLSFITKLLEKIKNIQSSSIQCDSKACQLNFLIRILCSFIKFQKSSNVPDIVKKQSTLTTAFQCFELGNDELSESICKLLGLLIENSQSMSDFESLPPNCWTNLLKLTTWKNDKVAESALFSVSFFISKSLLITDLLLKRSLLFVLALCIFGNKEVAGSANCQQKAVVILGNLLKDGHFGAEVKTQLAKILPGGLIDGLLERKASLFDAYYQQDHMTPVLIWNKSCRDELATYLATLYDQWTSGNSDSQIIFSKILYREEKKYLCVDGIYVDFFVKEEVFDLKFANNFITNCFVKLDDVLPLFSNADLEKKSCAQSNTELLLAAIQKVLQHNSNSLFGKSREKVESICVYLDVSYPSVICKKAISILSLIAPSMDSKVAELVATKIVMQTAPLYEFAYNLIHLAIRVHGIEPSSMSRFFIEKDYVKILHRLRLDSKTPPTTQELCRTFIDTLKTSNEVKVNQHIALVDEELEKKEEEEESSVDTEIEETVVDVKANDADVLKSIAMSS
ncbi:hypothetical protein RCL1_002345 [Eukaryota sp. TZLM3-RCL]